MFLHGSDFCNNNNNRFFSLDRIITRICTIYVCSNVQRNAKALTHHSMEASTDDNNKDEQLEARSSAAFTIDFGEGRSVDLERHKILVEKYQKRHRRGLSAGKLEEKGKGASSASTATSSSTTPTAPKKLSFTRKSSSSVEGSSYDVSSSEDQRSDRATSLGPTSPLTRKLSNKRERLSLPLKSAPGATERMVQSFTDYDLNSDSNNSVGIIRTGRGVRQTLKTIVKQLSSPECEMRKLAVEENEKGLAQMISGGSGGFTEGTDFDFDRRSDTVSETGTYTIDADVYTTEQKERMSIDRDFCILDAVAGTRKVAEYVSQLAELNGNTAADIGENYNGVGGCFNRVETETENGLERMDVGGEVEEMEAFEGYISDKGHGAVVEGKLELSGANKFSPQQQQQNNVPRPKKPTTLLTNSSQLKPHLRNNDTGKNRTNTSTSNNQQAKRTTTNDLPSRFVTEFPNTKLSPILSPTQQQLNDVDNLGKTFTKIMFPSPKNRCNNVGYAMEDDSNGLDQGSVISVTSSGAFRARNDLQRKSSLTKSDIYVEAYTDHQMELRIKQQTTPAHTLSANLVHMTSTISSSSSSQCTGNPVNNTMKLSNLPPSSGGGGGKSSPSKIPSPMMGAAIIRPRSRNGNNESDGSGGSNSLETECYLRPTQQLLCQLEKRLENTEKMRQQQQQQQQVWNNDLAKRPVHVRHNSLDSRNVDVAANKLEHFQRKNFPCIDQTGDGGGGVGNGGLFGAAHSAVTPHQQSIVRKVQNSPNNSPIRRSSSFTTKHQQHQQMVVNRLSGGQSAVMTNSAQFQAKEVIVNVRNSPKLGTRNTLQKSASTTNIKPLAEGNGAGRRGSVTSNDALSSSNNSTSPYHHHHKIDRSKYGDTESSSDDDDDEDVAHLHQTRVCATATKRKDISNSSGATRYNRAFSLRRGRLNTGADAVGGGGADQQQHARCPNTPEMRRKFGGGSDRATSVDRKPSSLNKHLHDIQPRYLQHTTTPTHTPHQHRTTATPTSTLNNNNMAVSNRSTRHGSAPPGRRDTSVHHPHHHSDHNTKPPLRVSSAGSNGAAAGGGGFSRGDQGRFSMGRTGAGSGRATAPQAKPMTNSQKTIRLSGANVTAASGAGGTNKEFISAGAPRIKQPGPRSNSSLSSKEMEFANWKRRKSYDPMKAAAEGKKRAELAKKQFGNSMTQSYTEATNQNSCDSSPSHSSSAVHRSQSFHGTAATTTSQQRHRLLLSSGDEAEEDEDEDEDLEDDSNEDLTLSADDDDDGAGFSPPTPSPSHQQYPASPWQKEMMMQRQNSREEQQRETDKNVNGDLA